MTESLTKSVTILGASGSIGGSTLDVIARHPGRFRVFAVTAYSQVDRLFDIVRRFEPRYAVMAEEGSAVALRSRLREVNSRTEVLSGTEALCEVAAHPEVDTVMAAIVGAAGLLPALAAARAGKRVLLANKEALVLSGALFMEAVRDSGACLLPIDSEHNAVFQSLPDAYRGDPDESGVRRILLTASGGPFRHTPADELERVTPQQACSHPNWVMGRKISVDSATLMNKGLEVIEAHWLFNVPSPRIDVVVHPQSVIHSMVEYCDGSVIAQLGNPDMRTPIAHALTYPQRIEAGVTPLNLFDIAQLTFERPDMDRFPCLGLAYQALDAGGTAPALLNAANEEAVEAFLAGRLAFLQIPAVIESVMAHGDIVPADSLDVVLAADRQGREYARREIGARQAVA